ncbi:MAG TPA: peptidoglycan DD-metalloendopeptidase family protein [Vicinamibacteria bacterium]|nr:peptidoglycan DD-metalloendopeptidase family protein [Vicinamibacteria bacterium]
MKKALTPLLAALVLLVVPTHFPRWMDAAPPPVRRAAPRRADDGLTVRGVVARNDTLASALGGLLSPAAVHGLVEAARPAYDLARITVGRPFRLALGADGLLTAFTYGIDELRTLRVVRRGAELEADVLTRSYETRTAVVAGRIDSSLFEAVAAAGEGEQLAIDLADIYAWDVDFNTEIQRGDSFRVVFEKQLLEGSFARHGRILAAELTRGDRVLRAFLHEGRGGAGYYDAEGRPLRRAFLRSPLRFTRISSRFSRSRLHPVLNVRRPHLGVDYAAPTGTPVSATGDGLVTAAGWDGGYGRAVRIRHANGYETFYGHLSRIQVRRGQRVSQGTRIGTVGSTGLATGPHLDYRMRRDGRFVDPLRVRSAPAAPVPATERTAFDDAVRRWSVCLEEPAPLAHHRSRGAAGESPGEPAESS